MTGPEHYREAERLAQFALDQFESGSDGLAALSMQQAQVHATLALAAVTVEVAAEQNGPSGTHQAGLWVAAVSS